MTSSSGSQRHRWRGRDVQKGSRCAGQASSQVCRLHHVSHTMLAIPSSAMLNQPQHYRHGFAPCQAKDVCFCSYCESTACTDFSKPKFLCVRRQQCTSLVGKLQRCEGYKGPLCSCNANALHTLKLEGVHETLHLCINVLNEYAAFPLIEGPVDALPFSKEQLRGFPYAERA